MINKLVLESLSSIGVPVAFQKYTGTALTYITFHEYLQNGEDFSEDQESQTGHYVQVDVWSKTDYTALVTTIKSMLLSAGFHRLNEADFYEQDTDLYHKGIKFFYLESKEET